MNRNYKMVATTLFGLEEVLAEELKNMGAQEVKTGIRNVSFVGDKGFMYKANMGLRTAIRILKPINVFKVYDEDDMYKKLQRIRWDEILNIHQTFAINAVVNSKKFTSNTHYIALKSKDAVVDYFRQKYKQRPSIDIKHPDVRVHIHIQRDLCTVSLDSSGDSLHKRGYRSSTNIAPINEVLAAGLVLLTKYSGNSNFIDPMCGSGTILIEAAMIANNIPANINRNEFGFEKWKDFDEHLFNTIQESLLKKISGTRYKIMGFDKAPSAIRKAKENIKNANLSDFVSVHQIDFFTTQKEVFGETTIVFNPPYGERLTINVKEFYSKIGDTLKQGYPNTSAWLITSDMEALKNVGLRTSKRIPIKNAHLDCKFVNYQMYEGSKKTKRILKNIDNS